MYKHLKSLILIIPTLTIGVWEYVRHTFLLPYISMELGNWLAPLLVFIVTMTLLRNLFAMMEELQEQLQQERAFKAVLEEREKIAEELHDGIAQSLFLLSVRVDKMEQNPAETVSNACTAAAQDLRKTIHEINEYVRQAIAGLRYPAELDSKPWMESFHQLIKDFRQDTGIPVHLHWELTEHRLSLKEKVELYSTVREALINVYKHAEAKNVWIYGNDLGKNGWRCAVVDDGRGFPAGSASEGTSSGFGLMIIKDRAAKLGWTFTAARVGEQTILELRKEPAL